MFFVIRSAPIMVIALCLQLSACAAQTAQSAMEAESPTPDANALTCQTANDCAVKNVGNCCGYYPACVHKDQSVDPDAVQARCNKEGTASICGFPEISACACVEGHCVVSSTGNSSGDPRNP